VNRPTIPREPQDDYIGERHIYEPHRAGLPPLGKYFRDLWGRRSFAMELARTQMRAANTDTVFGQAWLVINPLLLAGVYYLLVAVISGARRFDPVFFAQLTSGLFLYYYISGCISAGVTAVTGGGRLILNTSFPKMLLTISTVYTAFRRYLPTLLVFFLIRIMLKQFATPIPPKAGTLPVPYLPWSFEMLWMIPILFLCTLIGLGLANLFSTIQVYFRDTAAFLPYFIRIWLYLSPVLWSASKVAGHLTLKKLSWFNPIFGVLAAQSQILVEGKAPSMLFIAQGLLWGIVLLVGGSLFFMSRERDFAVRL